MATDWPTVADVQNLLRVEAGNPGDDTLVGQDLAAAKAWVSNRVGSQWVTPGPGFLPDPLFTACQMEAARLFRRRDSVDGTIGWGDMGVIRVGPKDPEIETLMAGYLNIIVG